MTPEATASGELELHDVTAGYGDITVVRDVSFAVSPGRVTVMVGQNGAGKTTTLRAIAGMVPLRSGSIHLGGDDLGRMPTHRRVRAGITFVPEGRGLATQLSTADNLTLAASGGDPRAEAVALFPELGPLMARRAGLLSGGEQQMLALARAVVTRPRVLLVDEMSLGLAPVVVERLVAAVRDLADRGVGVLVVEQHVRVARSLADEVVVLRRGEVIYRGRPEALDGDDGVLGPLDASTTSGLPADVARSLETAPLPIDPAKDAMP